MPAGRLTLGISSLILAVGIATGGAVAAPAYASTTVNVRSGAGTDYPIVDRLRAGERVEVDYCRGLWCLVEKAGPDGWVNANYLDANRHDDGGYFVIERPRYRPYYPYYRSQVCWGGRNASLCFGN